MIRTVSCSLFKILLLALAVGSQSSLHTAWAADDQERTCTGRTDTAGADYFVIPAINDEPLPPRLESYAMDAEILAAPPILHSRPSATQKLYLNFAGCASRPWGGWTAYSPAYDTDGNPATFSPGEQAAIEEVWKRVSEDFSPFNVDVTTDPPGSFPSRVALEVCIGGSAALWYGSSAGGVAYVGSWRWSPTSAVWVFEDNLGNGVAKYVAEAASHEIGHAFGLSHQGKYDTAATPCTQLQAYHSGTGSGETGWAPLMGVGYYQNLSTWHNGTTSCTTYQDDLAIITGASNSVSYMPDDYGATPGTATELSVSGLTVTGSGLITTTSDVDVFSFSTGSGVVTMSAATFEPGPNLDIKLRLLDGSSTLLASTDPAGSLDAALSTTVGAGTYYLEVSSSGAYARIGQYTIAGTVQASGTPDTQAPTAVLLSAPTVTNTGGTSYTFTVRYFDNLAVNVSTLNTGDVTVTKGGFTQSGTYVSVDTNSNGTPRTATYSFTPPGGAWDIGDNGTYTVTLNASQVRDVSSNAAAPAGLGTFQVSISVTDTDSDGAPDTTDNCPTVSNSTQTNTDGDSQGDACDPDDDNDGYADGSDCAPLSSATYRNQAYVDGDADGVRNTVAPSTITCFGANPSFGYTLATNGPDNCPSFANADQLNTDGDSEGNACDTDDDNDTVADSSDCAALDVTRYRDRAYPDSDGDGFVDILTPSVTTCYGATAPPGFLAAPSAQADNCPGAPNAEQKNNDGDGSGDTCDTDDDNDGVADTDDCAPFDATAYRTAAYRDSDGDGVASASIAETLSCFGTVVPVGYTSTAPTAPDNCPNTANSGQEDDDQDGIGNACESVAPPPPNDPPPVPEDPQPPAPKPRGPSFAPLDFDGDGTTDLLLRQNGTSTYYQILSSGATKTVSAGNPSDAAAPGEFTGDALWDVVTIRTEAGAVIWRVVDSVDGELTEFTFGIAGDIALSGCDFTGDSHTDAALIRGGQLLYRDSATTAPVFTSIVLGAGVDISSLACQDVTGDGRAEILLFESKLSPKVRTYSAKSANLATYSLTGQRLSFSKVTGQHLVMSLDSSGDRIADPGYLQFANKQWTLVQNIPISPKKSKTVKIVIGMRPSRLSPGRFPVVGGSADGALFVVPGGALYVMNSVTRAPSYAGNQPPGTEFISAVGLVPTQ